MNKYGAVRKYSELCQREFASKKEAIRAEELTLLEKAGEIYNLEFQPKYVLQDSFVDNRGKQIKSINYVGDFSYEEDGKECVEDTKGFATPVFKLKEKMFKHRYPEYILVIGK